MRIRVAIIEQDTGYLEKITNVFNTRYTEQVEIHAFTVMNRAIEFLQSNRVDMILVDEQIEMQLKMFPSKCNLAYLVDSMGIESVKGYPAICKFQKVDLIYKQILSIYSENSQSVSESHLNLGGSNVIAFMSPAGGTGTSSMAAACAMQCAGRGNNVLYLNLEKFGSSDVFFSGEGQFTMSDIIFALKGRKANLAMKLQSCVKKATCGGDFFSTSQTALDIDRDICWGHFCRWLNHIKTLFTLKKNTTFSVSSYKSSNCRYILIFQGLSAFRISQSYRRTRVKPCISSLSFVVHFVVNHAIILLISRFAPISDE